MKTLTFALLAVLTTYCGAQMVGNPSVPPNLGEVPACPAGAKALLYGTRSSAIQLASTGSVVSGGIQYFCLYPAVNLASQPGTNRIKLLQIYGSVDYGIDLGQNVAVTLYVDGSQIPVIGTKVGPTKYAFVQPMTWLIDLATLFRFDMSKREKGTDPHIYLDLRQRADTVSPKGESPFFIAADYQ